MFVDIKWTEVYKHVPTDVRIGLGLRFSLPFKDHPTSHSSAWRDLLKLLVADGE